MDYANELIERKFPPLELESKSATKEAFEWIAKNINSSRTFFHLKACERLIDLFQEMYERKDLVDSLHTSLYVKEIMLSIP